MWQLFKQEVKNNVQVPHTSKIKFFDSLVDSLENCYQRHVDILTGGGVLVPDGRDRILKSSLRQIAIKNIGSSSPKKIDVVNQIENFLYAFWYMRRISGPIGTAIILNTGDYSGFKVNPNLSAGGYNLIEEYSNSFQKHKYTLSGIMIQKLPFAIVPWSGVSFVTFGEGLSEKFIANSISSAILKNRQDQILSGLISG